MWWFDFDCLLFQISASVALHKHSNALVDVLPPEADSSISMLQADEKPDIGYNDIGGMDMQKQEMREAVELPLTHFDLYKQVRTLDISKQMCLNISTSSPILK